jgi:alpha-galactosidase
LNRPEKGDGIVMAFRRKNCNDEFQKIEFRGLEPFANYTLTVEDYGSQIVKTGSELMEGFQLIIKDKMSSLLISYNKVL